MTIVYRQIDQEMLKSLVAHTGDVLQHTNNNNTAEQYARSLGEARAALNMVNQVLAIYSE
jgi:hypothetical protein